MNQISKPAPALTPLLSNLLDSHELRKHRANVGLELEVLAKKFDRFGWERDRGSLAHDRLVKDWMDALQDYPLAEVQAACKRAVTENPNKMPNEGHVKAAILKSRAAAIASKPKPVEPERTPPTPEQKARVADYMEKQGFVPKRFPEVSAND